MPAEENPFAMTDLKEALPVDERDASLQSKSVLGKFAAPRFTSDNLELRISQGLLDNLFALSEAYITRGSAREAEYFAQQAQEFALSMNAPAMAARALAWIGEVQLHQGRLQDGYDSLVRARDMLKDTLNTDCADVRRLHGDYNQRCAAIKDARHLYAEAASMLEDLEDRFIILETSVSRYVLVISSDFKTTMFTVNVSRKSISSPHRPEPIMELLVPQLYASVLHQHSKSIRFSFPI
jgi:separase